MTGAPAGVRLLVVALVVGGTVSTLQRGMPQVCRYQRQEKVKVQVPTVRAYTATVKVLRPDCFTNAPDCVGYERRTKYRKVYQEREEIHTHSVFACCPGWSTQDSTEKDDKKGGRRHRDDEETSDGGDEGCFIRSETPPEEDGYREITHEGKVYHLTDDSQEKRNNSYFKGELYNLYKLVYGPLEAERVSGNKSTEDVPFLASAQPDSQDSHGNKSIKTTDYASDDPTSHEHATAGDPVLPQRPPSPDSEGTSHEMVPTTAHHHHRSHHHRRPIEATAATSNRHHRSRNRHNRHHHRRHRGRSTTSHDEDVEAKTAYEAGRNNIRHLHKLHRNTNDTEADTSSYIIIMSPGKRNGRRRGQGGSERPTGVAAQEQVSRLQELVQAPPGTSHNMVLKFLLGTQIDVAIKVREIDISLKSHPNGRPDNVSSPKKDATPVKETQKHPKTCNGFLSNFAIVKGTNPVIEKSNTHVVPPPTPASPDIPAKSSTLHPVSPTAQVATGDNVSAVHASLHDITSPHTEKVNPCVSSGPPAHPISPIIKIVPLPTTTMRIDCQPDLVASTSTAIVSPYGVCRSLNFRTMLPSSCSEGSAPGTSEDNAIVIDTQSQLPDLGADINLNFEEECEVEDIMMMSNFPSSDEITPFNNAQYMLSDDQEHADRLTLKRCNSIETNDDDDFVTTRPPKRGSILNRRISDIASSSSDDDTFIPQTQVPRVKYDHMKNKLKLRNK